MGVRTLSGDEKKKFEAVYPEDGGLLADRLQGSLPAISLVNASALLTAWGNDMDFDMVYAQQVYGFGKPGDTLLGISTSGNANNVLHAVKVAKILDIHTIGMTGEHGGMLAKICDAAIRVPASDTPGVQEYHLPVYHTLCAMLEAYFFSS
jgi:D-sedoheptulose 7-phosphate isomerase